MILYKKIWDVMSNDEVGKFIARRVAEEFGWVDPAAEDDEVKNEQSVLKASRRNDLPGNNLKGEVLARVGDDLLAACIDKGSEDNMSVLIVALPASGITNSSLSVAASNNSNVSVVDDTVRELEY